MFFRAFDMYMIKVLGGHPKDKRLEHIRERLAAFIVSEVISLKGEFHFKL
jgi:hypothetical protein